jgi:4-amino-4-deoxy-L-arabinose transferase-like glycosyltransferase
VDLVIVLVILVLSVPALLWFANHWTVLGDDSSRYLFAASQLISGQALEDLNSISGFNAGHGPAFPALISALIAIFGRDTADLVWTVRLMALLNPLLAYFLAKRFSSPAGGLVAAALVALLGYNIKIPHALNIDAPLLTFYLLAMVTLLAAIKRNSSLLAFLSGVLLGLAILTKETAIANLPLALLAVLLFGWELRRALWHYLGAVLICLPWWIWAYSATGEVYLVGRLPAGLKVPIVVAIVIFLLFAAVAYASGLVDRFLAGERRRRWSGWFVVFVWTISLTGMLLSVAPQALGNLSFEALRQYLAQLLAPSIVVVPTLLAVAAYVTWKAYRQDGAWTLLTLALLFQVPVSLLVMVELWNPRQFLIPQTLVFCALAALVVEAGEAALDRARDYAIRLIGALVAAVLASVVLVACVGSAKALLPEDPIGALSRQNRLPPQQARMADWMAKNVPKGARLLIVAEPLINWGPAYLIFLDGGRHEWTKLRLDQGVCAPRPNVQIRCDPANNAISNIPHDAIWVQQMTSKMRACKFMSLSMSNLLEQVRRENSSYIMIVGRRQRHYDRLPLSLLKSKAFRVAHVELAREGGPGGGRADIVLLERTGLAPRVLPTQMNAMTLRSLRHCEQAQDPGSAKGIWSWFSNGIMKVSD